MRQITTNELAKYLVTQIANGSDVKNISKQMALFLVSSNRANEVDSLLHRVEAELEKRGEARATVVSATKLTPSTIQILATALNTEAKYVEASIDESVYGGAKIQSYRVRLDLTVRRKLEIFGQTVRGK